MVEVKGKQDYEMALNTAITSVLFIILPMCAGVAILAKEVVFIYAGDKYSNIFGILILACITRIIISMESIMTNLVLYANNKEKKLVQFSFIFGLFNLTMNSILVMLNKLSPFSAMLTTGIAELLLVTTQYIYIKYKMRININLFTKQNVLYAFLSLLFIPISLIIHFINFGYYTNIILIIIICVLMYSGVLLLIKDSTIVMILNKFFGKFIKKKEKMEG